MPTYTLSEKRSSAVTLWKGTQDSLDDSTPLYQPHPPFPLPFPPHPPSYDSDSDATPHHHRTPSFTTTLRLRAAIATAPDTLLREALSRLVERTPGFQHALAKELLPPTPANPPSPRRKRRRSRRASDTPAPARKCVNCGQRVRDDAQTRHAGPGAGAEAECTYHPGHVRSEVYEFLSRTPEGRSFKVLRTLAMWSCCDEDAWGPGCVVARAHVLAAGPDPDQRGRRGEVGKEIREGEGLGKEVREGIREGEGARAGVGSADLEVA